MTCSGSRRSSGMGRWCAAGAAGQDPRDVLSGPSVCGRRGTSGGAPAPRARLPCPGLAVAMPTTDEILTITIDDDPTRTLTIRCPHAITTLPLPAAADTVAERTA